MKGLYGLLLVLHLLGLQQALLTGEEYLLSLGRTDRSNEITLMCQNRLTHLNVPGAKFWRYSANVGLGSEQICQDQSSCVFTITPAFEGYFFCGLEGPNSNNKTLVAYPSRNPGTKTFYIVTAGDTVELECGVGPGALSQYYTIQWMKDNAFVVNNSRYHIHASNFSLTIRASELSDGGIYTCYVAVDDPNSQNSNGGTEETLISLVVYEPPSLSTGPFEVLVVADGDQKSMTFTCTSEASTSDSELFWKQNGEMMRNGTRHAIIESTNGSHIESTLTVSEIRADDSGLIECEIQITADADPGNEDSGDLQTSPFSVSTSFTVLSDEFNLQVDIVTGGQLQFCFTDLTPNIPEPVKFKIRFTSVIEGQTKYLLTDSEYTITKDNMCFPIAISDVPFEEKLIRAQTAMMVGSVTGPYVPDMESAPEIDLTRTIEPTTEEPTSMEDLAPIIGGAVAGVVTAGVVLIVFVAVLYACIDERKRKKRIEAKTKHNDGVNEDVQYYREKARNAPTEEKIEYEKLASEASKRRVVADKAEENGSSCHEMTDLARQDQNN